MTQSTSAETPFGRRLFAALCMSLGASVAIGALHTATGGPPPERASADHLDRAAPSTEAPRHAPLEPIRPQPA